MDDKEIYKCPRALEAFTRSELEQMLEDQESELLNEEGELDDETYGALYYEIHSRLWEFLLECASDVEDSVVRERRNEGAETTNPHYNVYSKGKDAYQEEFKLVGTYTNLEDARDFINEPYKWSNSQYKIIGIRDGKEDGQDYYTSKYPPTPEKARKSTDYAF